MRMSKKKSGCWFTSSDLTSVEKEQAIPLPTVFIENHKKKCFRCASELKKEWQLPDGILYCRACILLGRLTEDDYLYYFPPNSFPKINSLRWQGKLTPYQQEVSNGLIDALKHQRNSLVHAVTGAGKTEMIYHVIATVLDSGGQVCLASPRIDVCLELYQRLFKDFNCSIDLLHGESEPYLASPLVIATTHQLLHFYQCFDLILVDEVDAFPYLDNDTLYHAVKTAKKESGVTVFMTATSTEALERQVKKGELQELTLSRRFHGNPLIVPKMIWLSSLEKKVARGKLPYTLTYYLKKQLQTPFPLLLFVPDISFGKQLQQLLAQQFPNIEIGFVASTSSNRLDRVEQFRKGIVRILITTTILERGVTFPKVDVFVLLAHHRLFNSSSLIQIGGRVGRSLERPTGDLLFFHEGLTKSIKKAKNDIQKMNKLGGF